MMGLGLNSSTSRNFHKHAQLPMPPAKAAKTTARKRVRKRKRRAVSSSSSSLSSDSSSSEGESPPKIVGSIPKVPQPAQDSSDSDDESEASESSSSTDSSTISLTQKPAAQLAAPEPSKPRRSPSPSPPLAEIPSFLPEKGHPSAEEKERELKGRFRKFWMTSVAEGFGDDLEELRKVLCFPPSARILPAQPKNRSLILEQDGLHS